MTVARRDLTRRSFDAIADMKKASSLEELDRSAGTAFEAIGLPSFALARFFKVDKTPSTDVIAGRFHPEWSRRYVERNYARSSTIASEMIVSAAPYSWSEAIRRRGLNRLQARIWAEAAEFGLTDGLFTPVRWSDGSYAAVVLAGRKPQLGDPLVLIAAEVLSSYYSSQVRHLTNGSKSKPVLTPRQRECLAWVRQGKSSGEIGEILGISVLTVDEHIADACRRLGVRTRVQAAVDATISGMIN